jgi:GH25 family lysozyme M1 (1,4-beta-N-acetylmuramidase)
VPTLCSPRPTRPNLLRTAVRSTAVATALVVTTAGAASATFQPGVDTSHWQHGKTSLNWALVKKSGIRFAFLKATEGTTFTDPYFAADWAATAKQGIYHGAYHFGRPSVGSARKQADYFVSKIGSQKVRGTLPPVLDLETTGGLGVSKLVRWTKNFLAEVQAKTGRTPLIYVSPAFWEERLGDSTAFHHYPLWIAHYGVSLPRVPGDWRTFSFWQSTSTGKVSGIGGNVDLDNFNGGVAGLQRFALAFDPIATRLTIKASNRAPTYGQTITISGSLTNPSGKGLARRTVTLARQASGGTTWSTVASPKTSSTGAWSFKTRVTGPGTYRARFAGTSTYKAGTSTSLPVTLTPFPTAITLATSAGKALAGDTVTFSGKLARRPSTPLADRPVRILRSASGSTTWSTVATAVTDARGAFSVPLRLLTSASYRASFAGQPAYAAASSPTASVAVSLRQTTLSLRVGNKAPYGEHRVRMAGVLRNGSIPVSGRRVALMRQVRGSSAWAAVARVRTDAKGRFVIRPRVHQAASYHAVFAGGRIYAARTSTPLSVRITPPASTRLTAELARSTLRKDRPTTLSGTLTAHPGEGVAGHHVQVWRRLVGSHDWRHIRTATVGRSGAWKLKVHPPRSSFYRVTFVGGTRYAESHSKRVRLEYR